MPHIKILLHRELQLIYHHPPSATQESTVPFTLQLVTVYWNSVYHWEDVRLDKPRSPQATTYQPPMSSTQWVLRAGTRREPLYSGKYGRMHVHHVHRTFYVRII